jgi:O-antigen/teichoic acid export membrane protein
MSLARKVARNSLWSGLDMLVDLVLPPLSSIVVARAFGPAKLGSFVYVIWISTTAIALSASGLTSAARKYMADAVGQKCPQVFRALLRTCLGAELILLLVVSLLALGWIHLAMPVEERGFATLIMLSILPVGVMSMATAVNSAVEELRPNVVASISSGILHTAGMLLAVLLGWGLVGLAATHLASRVCDCVVRWILTAARLPDYLKVMGEDPTPTGLKPRLPPGLGRKVAVFVGESTILALLTLVVWNRSETIFLKRFSAIEQVAYFSVAFGLSQIPGQIVGPFSRAAGVSVYAERGRDAQAGLHVAHVYWRYMVLLVMPACLGLAAMSGPLLRVLYGARYFDAAPVLMLAAGLSMFGPLGNAPTALITAAGGQRRLVVAGLFAAAGTLILDYILVRAYAAWGGALANGLGQLLSIFTTLWIARRYSFTISSGFVLRVTGAALGMAALVVLAVHVLPDLVGIVIGPTLGAIAYCALLRLGRLVDEHDVERLLKAESLLPRVLRSPYRRILSTVATPAAQPQPGGAGASPT